MSDAATHDDDDDEDDGSSLVAAVDLETDGILIDVAAMQENDDQ
ncbi:MAG: hypothetical protein ACRD0A_20595 [Acidimicrobiales bacterium]